MLLYFLVSMVASMLDPIFLVGVAIAIATSRNWQIEVALLFALAVGFAYAALVSLLAQLLGGQFQPAYIFFVHWTAFSLVTAAGRGVAFYMQRRANSPT